MDMPNSEDNLKEFKKKVKDIKVFEVSAATNSGLQEVADYLSDMIEEMPKEEITFNEKENTHKEYTYEKKEPFVISREDDVWVLSGDEIEKMFKMTKFESDEDIYRFSNRLNKMGVDDKLREAGAQDGDQVRILDFYFDFKD